MPKPLNTTGFFREAVSVGVGIGALRFQWVPGFNPVEICSGVRGNSSNQTPTASNTAADTADAGGIRGISAIPRTPHVPCGSGISRITLSTMSTGQVSYSCRFLYRSDRRGSVGHPGGYWVSSMFSVMFGLKVTARRAVGNGYSAKKAHHLHRDGTYLLQVLPLALRTLTDTDAWCFPYVAAPTQRAGGWRGFPHRRCCDSPCSNPTATRRSRIGHTQRVAGVVVRARSHVPSARGSIPQRFCSPYQWWYLP